MKFQAQSLFFASWIFALTTTTSAHGDHGVHIGHRSLLPKHHQYPHSVRGSYSHSRSSNLLKARGVLPRNLQKREKSPEQRLKLAEAYIKKETVEGTEWEIDSWYTDQDTGVTHVFAVQTVGGIRVDNARFNVNVLKDGTVFSSGSSFTKHTKAKRDLLQKRRRKLNPVDALKGAVETLHLTDPKIFEKAKAGRTDSKGKYKLTGGKSHKKNKGFKKPEYIIDGAQGLLSKPEATLAYMQREDGSLELTWRLEYDGGGDWLIIYNDAYEKNKIHSVADYTAHATYLVYKFDLNDPSEGERTQEVDPFKENVSPLGWQQDSDEEFTVLRGNNIIAVVNPGAEADYKDWTQLYSPDGGAKREYIYDFPMDSLNFSDWQDAAATQLFYTNNMIHDLYEQLGFTSQAGNFEDDLIGEDGGEGGDAVDVHVQYGAPINTTNAYFSTPPDGERPRMMMFLWPNPNGEGLAWRDSCFSRDVVIHEYTHGLSTRLTGGPENSECLSGTWESRGMGEGWGDFYAMAIGMRPGDTREKDYKLVPWLWIPDGQYDNPAQTGLRSWSYSTNMEINPLLYSSMDQEGIWGLQHQIGTIWCTILVEFLWNMVDKHGIEEDKFPSFHTHEYTGYELPTTGRHLAMKIVLEAMKLQPCNPSFVDARNAILDADIILTGGENYCEIWVAFAKRGLGVEAYDATTETSTAPQHVDDFSVPGECADVISTYEKK